MADSSDLTALLFGEDLPQVNLGKQQYSQQRQLPAVFPPKSHPCPQARPAQYRNRMRKLSAWQPLSEMLQWAAKLLQLQVCPFSVMTPDVSSLLPAFA